MGKNGKQSGRLIDAFALQRGEVISLVGGGGKTTIMFALARELVAAGNFVITTTTTRIGKPSSAQSPLVLVEKDEAKLISRVLENIREYGHITVAAAKLPGGKLGGVSPELVLRLAAIEPQPYIIVEADGAARKPLKAPNATEPVIPANTSTVVAVAGIDALGGYLDENNVFRAEIAAALLGQPLGSIVSADSVAVLLTHPRGITRGSPERARIIPFVNKVGERDIARGRDLAAEILAKGDVRIKAVVLGQAKAARPVREIVTEVAS